MPIAPFAITWDYRCPFARNAHEHVLAGLAAGAEWDVTYSPFSLNQAHVEEGGRDVWDDPAQRPNLLAMEVAVAVRDHQPEHFLALHRALFIARHDEGRDIREREVLADLVRQSGGDPDAAFVLIDEGGPLETFRKEHERSVADHSVFGVPTFITGDRAAFVRVMTRPQDDGELAVRTIERIVDAVSGWTELNELKHTTIGR
jgi:2-hydroxychromene-2-carboxylate isomerase